MKSIFKAITAVVAVSAITAGVASAMIPKQDLKQNQFRDEGISSQVFSDIDNGALRLRSSFQNRLEDDAQQSDFQDLQGKHLI